MIVMYEQTSTVGLRADMAPDFDNDGIKPDVNPIPKPDGEGWSLISVLPLEKEPSYLQYFWQRKK